MTELKAQVLRRPEDVAAKVAEFEERASQNKKKMDDWPSVEADMNAGISLMMMGFAMQGGPAPAYSGTGEARTASPWVAQVETYFRQTYGEQTGPVIAARVLERLQALADSMTAG